jgi:hypothetical protein
LKVSKKNPRASANFFGRNSFTPSSNKGFELLLRGLRMARRPSRAGIAASRQIDLFPAFSMIGPHRPRPLAHRRRAIWFAVPGNSFAISRGCAFSTLPGFNAMVLSQELVTRQFGTLRFNLGFGPLRCAPIGGSFSGSPMGVQAIST